MSRKKTKQDASHDNTESIFSKITSAIGSVKSYVQGNLLTLRTVTLSSAILILVVGITGGVLHGHSYEKKLAMTVSPIGQTQNLALSGVGVTLGNLYQNGNYTLVPFTFSDVSNVSIIADHYSVYLEPINDAKIDPRTQATIFMFGSTGVGAIVFKGEMPKAPINLLIKSDTVIAPNAPKEGNVTLQGIQTPVKSDMVAFVINPRANNVKVEKKLNSNVDSATLYRIVQGNKDIASVKSTNDTAMASLDGLHQRETEYLHRLSYFAKQSSPDAVKQQAQNAGVTVTDDDLNNVSGNDNSTSTSQNAADSVQDTLKNLGDVRGQIQSAQAQIDAGKQQIKDINKTIESMNDVSNSNSTNFKLLN